MIVVVVTVSMLGMMVLGMMMVMEMRAVAKHWTRHRFKHFTWIN